MEKMIKMSKTDCGNTIFKIEHSHAEKAFIASVNCIVIIIICALIAQFLYAAAFENSIEVHCVVLVIAIFFMACIAFVFPIEVTDNVIICSLLFIKFNVEYANIKYAYIINDKGSGREAVVIFFNGLLHRLVYLQFPARYDAIDIIRKYVKIV